MKGTLFITLKHLLIDNTKQIGLKYYPNKVTEALIKELPNPRWSKEFNMPYISNTKSNLDKIYQTFRGVVWIDSRHFFRKDSVKPNAGDSYKFDMNYFRDRNLPENFRACPESYLQKLEIRKYSLNTAKIYISLFEAFINYFRSTDLLHINEPDIRQYLQTLVQQGKSDSYINQAINSIKFYYEVVLGMPNRFYSIERPRKKEKLPNVLSKERILVMIDNTSNIKHKCIIGLLYSAGLRRNELLNLKIEDIDSKRNLIRVNGGKGGKDRFTLLCNIFLNPVIPYY